MKNKGFTTIEMIASFTIAISILVVLFNVVLMLKDNYNEIDSKTELLVSRDNLSYAINKKFKDKIITEVSRCEDKDNCFIFTYQDTTSDTLYYDQAKNKITFDDYTFLVTDDFKVDDINIVENYDTSTSTVYNGHFTINIPIIYDDKDYSIKVVCLFHTDNLKIVI